MSEIIHRTAFQVVDDRSRLRCQPDHQATATFQQVRRAGVLIDGVVESTHHAFGNNVLLKQTNGHLLGVRVRVELPRTLHPGKPQQHPQQRSGDWHSVQRVVDCQPFSGVVDRVAVFQDGGLNPRLGHGP